jgi:hypothetical protein
MAYILRRMLVTDVEAAKRELAETAADRRARGVARETYFTNPARPYELIVTFDGESIEQLCAALQPPASGEPPPPAEAPAEPRPVQVEVIAQLTIAREAIAAIEQRLGIPSAARESTATG